MVVEIDHTLTRNIFADGAQAVSLRAIDLGVVALATLVALLLLNTFIAPRFGMIDRPDGGRKSHTAAVPLTGGLALLLGVWVGALFATSIGQVNYEVLALLGIVATIHAFDDHTGLSARQRLVIDTAVAFAFIIITGGVIESFGTIWGVELVFGWFAIPLTIFAYLTLTNAYNMIDGVDGLALSQFLIAILSVGLWHLMQAPNSGFDPLAISVIAACFVVLIANTGRLGQRLKCFLGDSGSRFLGFFLVFVLVSEGTSTLSPIHGVYLIALPLFDMCAVVIERVRAGDGPMQADRRHLHHLILDAGGSRQLTVLTMAVISLALSALIFVQKIAGVGDIASLVVLLVIATSYFAGRRAAVRLLMGAVRGENLVGPAE